MIYLFWENNDELDVLPKRLYVEIDNEMYESRKIEFYESGEVGFANDEFEIGRTALSDKRFPSLKELRSIMLVPVVEISNEEFEKIWNIVNGKKQSK